MDTRPRHFRKPKTHRISSFGANQIGGIGRCPEEERCCLAGRYITFNDLGNPIAPLRWVTPPNVVYKIPHLGSRGFENRLSDRKRYNVSTQLPPTPNDVWEERMRNARSRDIDEIPFGARNRPRGRRKRLVLKLGKRQNGLRVSTLTRPCFRKR